MLAGGDIVIAIDQVDVKRFDDVVNYLASFTSVGDVVTLTVVREGEEVEIERHARGASWQPLGGYPAGRPKRLPIADRAGCRGDRLMVQRILVVDDDREIVRLVRTYLEKSDYEVLVAYDGETALHILRRERPDLVLLDLMLPDRDGRDVTRVVRGDAGLAAMPIIMLTARVEDHDKIVGLELGADDYVTKPFNPGEVVARVRAVLRRRRASPLRRRVIRAGAGDHRPG